MENQIIDHLFRHQYGKMVSVLTRIFGLQHLETIEDAVQDTFISASQAWRNNFPENPEAWLTTAAKNRAYDLFKKLKATKNRENLVYSNSSAMAVAELFLDNEIEDSQLRMIFTACHPSLNAVEQIAFALKTISGFSTKEIASSLLLKEETIKKRLSRARKTIQKEEIKFEIPQGIDLKARLPHVLEVLYLIFNEGFHSNNQDVLIRKDLCSEAMRLVKLLLKKEITRHSNAYALFALLCFHLARLDSKIGPNNELIDLKHQDRKKWFFPLIKIGNDAMNKAVESNEFSIYHYEAAIVSEHLKSKDFQSTNWEQILFWYEKLYAIQPTPLNLLNQAIVFIQLKNSDRALKLLQQLDEKDLESRSYIYHATFADYYLLLDQNQKAISSLEKALSQVKNQTEKSYLLNKKSKISTRS